jgi:outer membrane protein TolC
MKRMTGWSRLLPVLGVLLLVASAQAVTLDACIAAALRQNPDVRAASERVKAAQASLREAQSAYYPRLGASAAYARTDNPPQAFMMQLNQRSASLQSDFNNPEDTDNLALSLGLQYRLFDFGRRELDTRMAREGSEISQLVLRGLQNELIHQVTRGYYAVLQAEAFTAVREETVQTLEESLRVARERLAAGGAVKTDVLNLDVQLAQANDELIRSRNGVALSLAALNTAIGADLAGTNDMPVKMELLAARPEAVTDPAVVRERPEYLAAEQMAIVRNAGVQKARRQYAPVVNGFGSMDWNSGGASEFEQSYMVGVQAEVTLFDGFQRSAGVANAEAQERAARDDVDKAANNLKLDLVSASLQAGEAWDRLAVARKSIENAEEALRITREKYKLGAADIPELLTAQVGLSGTRTRNVAALYDCLTALSNLERARGTLVKQYAKNINGESIP